jgi:hypothetical protein
MTATAAKLPTLPADCSFLRRRLPMEFPTVMAASQEGGFAPADEEDTAASAGVYGLTEFRTQCKEFGTQ